MSDAPGRAFRTAFGRRAVAALADPRSFQRGLLYAANGRVGRRTVTPSSVKAKVRGSTSYQVKLWLEDDDEPSYDCSCPVGQDGRFCKHAVALALVATEAATIPEEQSDEPIDLRGYLAGLPHEALVDLLVERAGADDLLDARLRMEAARATGGAPQVGVFRSAIDEAFLVDGYVGYREMYDYASNIDAVLDSLQDLLDDGHAEAVMALAEHAVDCAEDALGYVDDSDGWMSGIAERLQDLHRAACEVARPDPVALARTLFERERESGDLDVFHAAAQTYADVLGPEGLAEYRLLAQEEWDALPQLGPKDERSWAGRRYRITKIMETLAEVTGDVDEVVQVLARDQSSAYQFVRIVEVLREATRYDDALAWAEKGLALHGRSDSRLVEAAADEYHRAGRGEDAVRLAWEAYDDAPTLATYRRLAEQAQRAGVWADWHDRAVDLLRARIAKSRRAPSRGRAGRWPAPAPDGSTLVEVLLYDGEVEQAWAEAHALGCRRALWLELARRREADHPGDAIPIWQDEVESLIRAKNNQAYAQAVELITHVGRLMTAGGRETDFGPYVAGVRVAHKPKRNLMKLFDQRGW